MFAAHFRVRMTINKAPNPAVLWIGKKAHLLQVGQKSHEATLAMQTERAFGRTKSCTAKTGVDGSAIRNEREIAVPSGIGAPLDT